MEIQQIRYFIQICNDKSFSKAAENLHISQQGLSKTIKNLEDELEISLLNRSSRGVKPTEFGNLLFLKSQKIVDEFDLMIDSLYNEENINKGKITIGLPSILYTNFLAAMICSFQENYPDIQLEVIELGSYACEKGMKTGSLDISFIAKSVSIERFQFIPIMTCDMILLVSKDHILNQRKTVKLKDLKNENFIMLSHEYSSRQFIIDNCLKKGFKPNIAFTTSVLDLTIELVSLNKGIALLPNLNSIKAAKMNNNVSAILVKDKAFKIELGFITNKSRNLNHIVNTLINYSLEYFKTCKFDMI